VAIVNSFFPLYVYSGETVTLTCQTGERSNITWEQKTPDARDFTPIIAGEGFTIEKCRTEPSGFSQSTLSRSSMSLNARGAYRCNNNDGSTYTVTAVVLYSMYVYVFLCRTMCPFFRFFCLFMLLS